MKIKYALSVVLLLLFFYSSQAQTNSESNPTYEGRVSFVEYVSPMASRPGDLLPPDNSVREARDKRSISNQISRTQEPKTVDDYFVRNRHQLESNVGRAPASLVFDTYASNSQPTDPSLAIGPNHVFVVYNTGFMIYDKSGNQLLGETSPNPAIFPAGGCCDLTVSYDNAADRWVLTFLGSGAQIAVSDGPNPLTAGWYLYTIAEIQDYQKLSVWSDGYYITENTGGSNKVWALERSAMLAGSPGAQILGFDLPSITTSGFFSPQVLNVTDSNLPATGGATVVYLQDDAWSGVSNDHIKLWTIDVDWGNTGNSSISSPQEIPLTAFISVFDNGSFSNLSQPGGGSAIDALQATIMNQAQFRKFSGHNSAVFNFVVDADGSNGELAGVRWVEFRQSGDNQPWSLYQEGTYTAPDGRHAWNASLAMDGNGNIGMGYTSMSGPSTQSTVRVSSYFTGRLSSDPLGTMTSAEGLISNGNANISGTRFGDYSKIDVDPSDDSSFWFITEYVNNSRKGVVGKFAIQAGPPDLEDPSTPTNLVASNVTSGGATLTWTASTDNVGVSLYSVLIDGAVVGTTPNTTFAVTGLSPLTLYAASIIAQDAAGNTSGSATVSFSTLDGSTVTYCASASTNISDEFIGRVQLNTIDNVSGGQFYTDFTSIATSLTEGDLYTVTVTPTWTGTVYSEGYAVWIDYNNDGDFADGGELVWSKAASTNTPNSGSFTVPSGTSGTSTRMRVSMKYNGIPSACETFTYGEVEDYTVNLSGAAADTEAPSNPTNLSATNVTETTVELSWNASSDNVGVTGYDVYQGTENLGTIVGTTSEITGLTASTSYTFTVRARDAAGNVSGDSNALTITTDTSPDTEAPNPPTNLIATNVTETTVALSWNASSDNVGVTGYDVYQGTTNIGTVADTSAQITDLSASTTYTFTVRARDAAGNVSVDSNAVTFTTDAFLDIEAPTNPTSLAASSITETTAELSWIASSDNVGVTEYDVYQGTTNVATVSGTTYQATGLTASTSYTYTVRARDAAGNVSGESNAVTFTTDAAPDIQAPSTPTNLVASNTTDTSIGLSWNVSSDNVAVTGYEIFEGGFSVAITTGPTATVTGLTANTSYSFNVRAFDAAGNNSALSNTVNETTTGDSGGPGVIAGYYFETGLEGWIDGGSDCRRFSNATYAYEGAYSIEIRDNTSTSNARSPIIDLSGNTEVTIEFHTYSVSMENGEDFFVEFFNGSTYQVIGQYVRGVDFNNNAFFTDTIVLNASSYSFNANNRFRFRNDASGNNDKIYFDQVIISGDNITAPTAPTAPTSLSTSNITETTVDLSWNASSDDVAVTGYEIYEGGVSIGTSVGTTATVSGLTANTSYVFNVRAFDADGNSSDFSNSVNATTSGGGGGGGPGIIAGYYFETGLDGWIDGGSDCVRFFNDSYAFEGSYSIRLRDDSNSSNARSPILDLSGNSQVTIEFNTYSQSMENGEDFFVEFFDGSTYQVIGQYVRGTDFNNNAFFTDTIVLDASTYNFNANNRFRFRNDASANNDKIYFDQVIISGDSVSSMAPLAADESAKELRSFTRTANDNIKLYPNPAKEMLNIEILEGSYDEITVFSALGNIVHKAETGVDRLSIDVSQLSSGMYFIRFVSNGLAVTKRFIKE